MMKYQILTNFILVLLIDSSCCHADNSKQRLDVKKQLESFNKHAIKSIKSPDGDIIDCVDINKQPAFDHPSLKNHSIQMRPSYHPEELSLHKKMNSSKNDSRSIRQLWHNSGRCPIGTIPIRRVMEDDVLRASSIKRYGKKNLTRIPNPKYHDLFTSGGHEYAAAYVDGDKYFGGKATINLWKPQIQQPDEISLSQIWINGGPASELNTIEAGWAVHHHLFGDYHPRLFIYWTRDGYQVTGCYNLICPGFVQTSHRVALGARLIPLSTYQGSQYVIHITIWKDSKGGNWWMQFGNDVVGYWPATLFTYLQQSASMVTWGGEVVNTNTDGHHTSTQMGSGHFPDEGNHKASFVRDVEVVDGSNKLYIPQKLTLYADHPDCYNIQLRKRSKDWGSYFFYGGPGKNPKCP